MHPTRPSKLTRRGVVIRPAVLRAQARALFARGKLPPGTLDGLDVLEKSERTILLRNAEEFGPIFRATAYDQFWVVLIGLGLGRRFLREHADHLQPVTVQLDALVPGGFMRQMRGETHRRYRRALIRALAPGDVIDRAHDLESLVTDSLRNYAETAAQHRGSSTAYLSALTTIATGMLIQVFFGAVPGSPRYEQLMCGYHDLGPFGMVWNIGDRQRKAFREIRGCLRDHVAAGPAAGAPGSILERMHAEGVLDDTLLGNLIYMVEMGRYDTRALFRWMSRYAATHPELTERIAREAADPGTAAPLSEAFVLETLRMDQSERLLRRVERDLVFDGHFIPKASMVRVCLWESHKSEETFPEAFRFHPERFLGQEFGADQFAPFGLDHHQCPLGNVAMKTSLVFLRTLAREYTVAALNDGDAVRGAYHWEPATGFSVRLERRGSI